MTLRSHWWWDHSAKDFAALEMERVVAVLPVGAVEQHGPHLPVRVDAAINAGIVQAAVDLLSGRSARAGAADDAGRQIQRTSGLSRYADALASDAIQALVRDRRERARAGCRQLILFNSHGGQPQVVDIVCRQLRIDHGMFAVNAMWSPMTKKDDLFSASEPGTASMAARSRPASCCICARTSWRWARPVILLRVARAGGGGRHPDAGRRSRLRLDGAGSRTLRRHGRCGLGGCRARRDPGRAGRQGTGPALHRGRVLSARADHGPDDLHRWLRGTPNLPLEAPMTRP